MLETSRCIHVQIGDKPSETVSRKYYYSGPRPIGGRYAKDKDHAIQLALVFLWKYIGHDTNPWQFISGWQDELDEQPEQKIACQKSKAHVKRVSYQTTQINHLSM